MIEGKNSINQDLISQIIWVLDDNRAGNFSQAMGLGEAIVDNLQRENSTKIFQLKIKKIGYNSLAKLPNFLKINGLIGVDIKTKNSLLKQKPPQIIISAGRKTAPISLFLKNYYQNLAEKSGQNSKIICLQIMKPSLSKKQLENLDLIILPKHDQISSQIAKLPNLIRIVGAMHRIDQKLINEEYKKFVSIFDKINSPKIAFLLGGSSKKGKFTPEIAQNLAKNVGEICNKMQAHLLVLNSRRTGEKITEIIDQNLNCSKTFFKWQSTNWQNPYFAVLKAADFIIVTGDSISMCSEVCSLGKPVYIFNPKQICPPKHLKFHQNLLENGFAKKLDLNLKNLEYCSPNKLDETKRIADFIVNQLIKKLL